MIAQQVSRTGRLVGRAPRNITVVLTRALPVILSIARKVSQSGRLLGRRQSESGAATKRAQGARPLQHLNRMIAKRVTKIGRLDGLGQRKAGAVQLKRWPAIHLIARMVSDPGKAHGLRQNELGAATIKTEAAQPLPHLDPLIAKRGTRIGNLDGRNRKSSGAALTTKWHVIRLIARKASRSGRSLGLRRSALGAARNI